MSEHLLQHGDRFNEEGLVEAAEKVTVEEWEILTIGWHKKLINLTNIIPKLSPEQRQNIVNKFRLNIFFGILEDEDGGIERLTNVFSFSDEALGRLNTALRNNEQTGLLSG